MSRRDNAFGGVEKPLAKVSVVVPVRDDAWRLARCLASIRENRYQGAIEIIVADNGSRDGSQEVAHRCGAIVLSLPGRSVAQLRNAAARAASGDVLAFVDADHIVDRRWIETAVEAVDSVGIGAAGAPYLPPSEMTWVQRAYDRFRSHHSGVREVEWLGAGNLAVPRQIFFQIGGFDENLETCEDVDLCNRLRAASCRLISDDRLKSVHLGDPATLRSLFLGELWRGRDNLRVTVRGPLTVRTLSSLLIPAANLTLLTVAFLGLLLMPWLGLMLVVSGLAGFVGLAAVRTVRMTISRQPRRVIDLVPHFVVAAAYEGARALALVARAGHRVRRELSGEHGR